MFCLRNFSVFFSCVLVFISQSGHGSKIIGGKEVPPHSLPFMALVEGKCTCGGTLIHPQWVLTAAHCSEIKQVILGVHSRSEKDSCEKRAVEKHFQPHPKFTKETWVNDLMLLKLDTPVKKTKTVDWLNLPNTSQDPAPGSTCLVAGWGQTQNDVKQMSDVLMSVDVTVIDREICNSADYYNHKPVITSDMICAGSDGKNKADTCSGDSGGPLLCSGALIGVTSFGGEKCGDVKNPGVYSFLSEKQLRWIQDTVNSF